MKRMCDNVNYYRAKGRPGHVEDLSFEINHAHIPPEFLRGDIHVGDKLHLIFMTRTQIDILKRAKTW